MDIKKLKIVSILGTRPEIIRLSRILPKMDEYFDHVLVYTQQSYDYELSSIFFKELKIRKPDCLLSVKADTMGQQIGNILSQTEEVMLKEKPEALLVLGDTNSSLSAIIAKRLNILIFHMEAGNRCFDWSVPEETNRALVDVISDYNLPYTEHARRYLLQGGIHPSKTFVTGSPLTEVYDFYKTEIEASDILKQLSLKKRKYFVVSAHREENVDNPDRLRHLLESFNAIADIYKFPLIVTLHPRTKRRLPSDFSFNPLIQFHKPFGIFDYIKLEQNSYCVLSDSGTIQEESAILDFNAVQIRVNMERPEAFDKGTMVLIGLQKDAILNGIQLVVEESKKRKVRIIPQDYLDTNISTKVVKLIMGITSVKKNRL